MGRRGGDDGDMGPRGSEMPSFKVVVRWESALPVKEALARQANQQAAEAAAEHAGKDYVIAVIGLRPHDSRSPERDPDQMRSRLLDATLLTPKGRDPIAPKDIQVDANSDVIRFIFPASAQISLDDKEVRFQTHMGPMKLEQKFHPKEMTMKGKLAI